MIAKETKSVEASSFNAIVGEYGYYATLVVALVAMLGSLYFSEILFYEPCRLCWFQRIAMYPIVLISLIGIIKQDEYLPTYVLPLSLIGLSISVYHILIQNGIVTQSTGCTNALCSIKYINWLGFISIPVLAGTAFLIISVLMFLSMRYQNSE